MTLTPMTLDTVKTLLAGLKSQPKANVFLAAFALVALIGFVDYFASAEFSFSLFYLLPVFLVVWLLGRGAAELFILVTAGFWTFSEVLASPALRYPVAPLWNLFMRIGILYAFAHLLRRLEGERAREALLSRTDPLTGAANPRAFQETAQRELERSQRYGRATTVSYIDLDNFKLVNDRFGHKTGDELLQVVAHTLLRNVRASDTVTRIGGDEFIVLMPETDHTRAEPAVRKLRALLLGAMQERGWPVTFSIGVMTFRTPPDSVEVMVQKVDGLMYAVKNGSKNAINFDNSSADFEAGLKFGDGVNGGLKEEVKSGFRGSFEGN